MSILMPSPHQDLTAILQILYAALSQYGCPQAIVSDNGSVFRAGDYVTILRALKIEPLRIDKGKPWQNLIETQFKIQLRLADFKFEQAHTLEAIQDHHGAFIETFNTTRHWGPSGARRRAPEASGRLGLGQGPTRRGRRSAEALWSR
jgi:putative transposase